MRGYAQVNRSNFKIKDLTFKISMVYDEHHFNDAHDDVIQEKILKKEGGDLNDKGGVNRQHREGSQNLKSSS
jgi:hypothetical protein